MQTIRERVIRVLQNLEAVAGDIEIKTREMTDEELEKFLEDIKLQVSNLESLL